MKKIAIFSDIHGNLQALESIINDIKSKGIDEIICLGDIIGSGPNPKECLDIIINNNIKMVLGNHELYYLRGTNIDDEMEEEEIKHHEWVKSMLDTSYYDYLSSCPLTISREIYNKKLLFLHFLLNPDTSDPYLFDDLRIINNIIPSIENIDCDYIFIGHEHKSFEASSNNNKIIDIGSSGCRKDDNTFYTILYIDENNINIEKVYLKYDRDKFLETFNSIEYPDKKMIGKIYFIGE